MTGAVSVRLTLARTANHPRACVRIVWRVLRRSQLVTDSRAVGREGEHTCRASPIGRLNTVVNVAHPMK
jgi:hypothetical protein